MASQNDTDPPPERDQEVIAESMLYASIFNEQSRFNSAPECRARARAAVEDFRESRCLAKMNRPKETRQ